MYKKLSWALPALLLLASCAARIETSSMLVRWDQPRVEQATQKIADRLHLTAVMALDSIPFLVSREQEIPQYSFRALMIMSPADSFHQLAVSAASASRAAAVNVNKCVSSFYLQELEPGYADKNQDRLIMLPPKTMPAMRKRAWLNLGCGMRYAGKANPLVDQGGNRFWSVALGVWDVAHYGLIIGGPFIGKTDQDKIQISAGGVVSLLAWKLFMTNFELRKTVLGYNTLAGTGYAVPREITE
jgi:hypothetical protein